MGKSATSTEHKYVDRFEMYASDSGLLVDWQLAPIL